MNKKEKNTYKNAFQVYCSCPKDITLLCIALFFLLCTFLPFGHLLALFISSASGAK